MLKHSLLIVAIASLSVSCGDDQPSNKGDSKPQLTIGANGVSLVSHSIKEGNPSPEAIEAGLRSAAEELAFIFNRLELQHPGLSGDLRGTFHLKRDGTVQVFAVEGSKYSTEGGRSITSDFIKATLRQAYQFPELGDDVLLEVHFKLTAKK